MTSKIVVNNIEADAGINTVTISGDVTATNVTGIHHGSGADLTNLPAANLTGTLPALDGSALTGVGASFGNSSVNTSGIITATAFVPTQGQFSHRNVIINGDAKVSQRATAKGSITSGGYYAVDRWYVTMDTAGTWTMYQDADVPSGYGFSKSVSLDVNTANTSLSAGSRAMLSYRLEGQDVQRFCKGTANAKKYALSFWVKCGKTGTYVLELFDHDNSRHICKTYTISSANTWEQKKLIFDNETSNAFGNDNGKSLELQFYLAAGSNFTSGTLATSWASNTNANRAVGQVNVADSTSNKYFLTGVQLEVGPVVTPFEHRSFGDELRRCQRYYHRLVCDEAGQRYAMGLQYTSAAAELYIQFPEIMRTKPTAIETTGTASDYAVARTSTWEVCNVVPTFQVGMVQGCMVRTNQVQASLSTGQSTMLRANTTNFFLGFSAEL